MWGSSSRLRCSWYSILYFLYENVLVGETPLFRLIVCKMKLTIISRFERVSCGRIRQRKSEPIVFFIQVSNSCHVLSRHSSVPCSLFLNQHSYHIFLDELLATAHIAFVFHATPLKQGFPFPAPRRPGQQPA